MKNSILFSCLLLIGLAASCKKSSDNLSFSPFREIDLWVKNNMDTIAKMNRIDVIRYSKAYQRAIFAAKSPEQRFALWNDKYTELLNHADLSNNQRNNIITLQGFLSVDIFKPDYSGKPELLQAINNWAKLAIRHDVFSFSQINQLLLTLESEFNTPGAIANRDQSGGGGGTEPDCECNQDKPAGFVWEDCGESQRCKKCDSCLTTYLGCGPMYLYPCDGNCLNQGQECQ